MKSSLKGAQCACKWNEAERSGAEVAPTSSIFLLDGDDDVDLVDLGSTQSPSTKIPSLCVDICNDFWE